MRAPELILTMKPLSSDEKYPSHMQLMSGKAHQFCQYEAQTMKRAVRGVQMTPFGSSLPHQATNWPLKNDVEHMDHPLILFSCICKVADWGKWVCLSKKKITNKKPSYFIPRTPDVCHVIVTEWEGNTCSIILEEWTYQQLLFAYSINSPPWSP